MYALTVLSVILNKSASSVSAVLPSCALSEYECVGGGCVSARLRCDGQRDCSDGSDEVSAL